MNDIRRTILWVIFGFSMILLWDQWQIHNGQKATFFPAPKPAAAVAAPGPAASGVPSASNAALPAATIAGQAPAVGTAPVAVASQRIEVISDVLKMVFSTEGGNMVRAELTQHNDTELTKDEKPGSRKIVLLDESKDRIYLAQSGLVGMVGQPALPNHKSAMTFSGDRALKDGQNDMSLRFESADMGGIKLVKTYTVKRGAYDIAVKHEIINSGAAPVSAQLYMQLVRDGNKPAGESSFYSTFTGPVVYTTEKKYQKVEFTDIEKNKADFQKETTGGYIAMAQHYFASAWLMADGEKREMYMQKVDTNLYSVGVKMAMEAIAPGVTQLKKATLFVGPQVEHKLEALYPGFELVKDYGWLTILAKPMYWVMEKLHGFIGNWGWTIIALVILIKAAFYWLNAQAYRSMAKMKAVNPKIMEMRERLKDKPQEMQQQMMKIYKEEKVNPMGGCFPIMVQIPVFIALYWVLLSSVEFRGAPWVGWIRDLSLPDPWYLLPVIMTFTTMLQTALNPAPPDPLQAKLMWYMPLAFSVMFFFFPAGLVLYWITNNVLSIAQQWLINTRMGVPPQFNLPTFLLKKKDDKKA
jgi:YidC/Oxa1 family membrane protein insertase